MNAAHLPRGGEAIEGEVGDHQQHAKAGGVQLGGRRRLRRLRRYAAAEREQRTPDGDRRCRRIVLRAVTMASVDRGVPFNGPEIGLLIQYMRILVRALHVPDPRAWVATDGSSSWVYRQTHDPAAACPHAGRALDGGAPQQIPKALQNPMWCTPTCRPYVLRVIAVTANIFLY